MDLKSKLLASRLPTDTVDLPDIGEVRVRGLSRDEVTETGRLIRDEELDTDGAEVRYLVLGMVEPALSADEVRQWRKSASSKEVSAALDRILELSGLAEGAGKSDV